MKLVRKAIEKDGSGYVRLIPEDDDDMWHVYNLIAVGDEVKAQADRKVVSTSATGSTQSRRIQLNLKIIITMTHFSPSTSAPSNASASIPTTAAQASSSNSASDTTATMQLTGRVSEATEHVKMGSYHTLDLEPNRAFDLYKTDGWDSIALERIEDATKEGRGAEVGAIVLGEGTAVICLVSEFTTVIRQRIEVSIPRKQKGDSKSHEKAMTKFYKTLYASILRNLPYQTLRCIIVASPGFTNESAFKYVFEEAARTSEKPLLASKSKWILVHTTSSHVGALVEAMKGSAVEGMIKDTKFMREGRVLEEFNKMLSKDPLRAWYGPDHVLLAISRGAVGTLLISDDLFRSSDVNKRKTYVQATENVKEKGGNVVVFSSMHESGLQLNQLTGICAILTFPLDVEMVEEEERVAAEEEKEKKRQELVASGEERS